MYLAKLFILVRKIVKRLKMYLFKSLFKSIGSNVIFDPNDDFSYETISIGSDVFIGSGAILAASESSITLGNKIMFGPNVTIMGGDHNISEVGEYMFDVKNKLYENDLPVVIKDDVWVGCNATILKGVTISQGAVIAAGALVLNDVEEYAIYGGVPAKKIGSRFSSGEIEKHKKVLGLK